MTTLVCPICGSHESWHIPFNRESVPEAARKLAYDWRMCRACGNGFPSRQPDLELLRAIWTVSRRDADADPAEEKARWAYRRRVSRVVAERSFALFAPLTGASGRFLDVACGLGETVRVFADRGWDAEGIDADETMYPLHREIGIRSRIGQFETVDVEGQYDIIHIAHAIYFITDPMGFLARVKERLAPGGHLCIVLANFMASTDPGLPSYAHSFFPTGKSMQRALALAGYETVFRKRLGGSVFLAARPADRPAVEGVSPMATYLGWHSKRLRFAMLGRPQLALRGWLKRLLGRS